MADVTTSHKWLQLPDEVVARYNYLDCLAAARATTAIKRQLAANKQLAYFEREVWPLLPAVLAMQRRGLPYNSMAKGQYRKRLRKELRECDTKLRSLYAKTANYEEELAEKARIEALVANPPEGKEGQKYRTRKTKGITLTKAEETRLGRRLPETWNPNSDDQVRRWLFSDLGLRPSTSTAGGKPSVDMDALSRIYRNLRKMDEHARPALHDLMHRARLQKIDQDYLDPEVTNGRVYPTIKMTGTENARFSYADPPVHSWPDEVRHLVQPDEDYDWLGADYQQVEARVFAILTNDTTDLKVYERFDENPDDKEWDIHYRTACDLFGYTIGELLSRPTDQIKGIRVYSKNFRYGVLLYGGGPTSTKAKVGCPCPKCANSAPPTVSVTPKERKRHAERWFAAHPNVYTWREQISYQVMRSHTITTPLGRKRYFMKPWGPEVQREAWNSVIQTTAAEIIHRAMRSLHTLGCPLCLQHHDALYAEVAKRDTNYWAQTIKTVMEQPVAELGNRKFPVDLEVGPSWGEMEHYELDR
jgi:DNA polymerase-1